MTEAVYEPPSGRACSVCGCTLFDWKTESERKDPDHEYECERCGAPGPDPAYAKHPGNQPCEACGRTKGTFSERGFDRCNHCGFPGQ